MTPPYALHESDGLLYVTAPALDAFDGLSHAFSTRVGGVSQGAFATCNLGMAPGEESANVLENRRRLFAALRLPHGPLTTVSQVHSAEVAVIRPPASKGATGCEADAMVTDCVEAPLAVFHADCPPLVIYDPARRACGLAHAGREGVRKGVARALVETMIQTLGSRPGELQAAVGPGIRSCCYEVGPGVVEAWRASVPGADGVLRPGLDDRSYLDLPGALAAQLSRAGLAGDRIHDTGLCTACRTDLFYSYRAEGPATGRLMTLVVLLPAVA